MNKIKFINWLSIIITIFLCLFWYYMSNTKNDSKALDKQFLKKSVDITVYDISVKEFNEKGKLANFLESKEVNHIPHKNIHILTNPRILIQEGAQDPWYINAKLAKAINGGKKITFSDEVMIVQKKVGNNDDIRLSTEEITYFPNKKYAITQKDVKLQQSNSIVEATGLKAFLNESRIQFLKNARGHYEQKNS